MTLPHPTAFPELPTIQWSDRRYDESSAHEAADEIQTALSAMEAWAILDLIARRPGLREEEIVDIVDPGMAALGTSAFGFLAFGCEETAASLFGRARWGETPRCPRCAGTDVYETPRAQPSRQLRFVWDCRTCRRTGTNKHAFSVRTGTVFRNRTSLRVNLVILWDTLTGGVQPSELGQRALALDILPKTYRARVRAIDDAVARGAPRTLPWLLQQMGQDRAPDAAHLMNSPAVMPKTLETAETFPDSGGWPSPL
jgi:hypothetical protein